MEESTIKLIERVPYLGMCHDHFKDICKIEIVPSGSTLRTYCQKCKCEQSDKIQNGTQFAQSLMDKLYSILPSDEESKQTLAQNVKGLVDEVEELKQIFNETLAVLSIDSSELCLFYSLLSLPKDKFQSEFYKALSKNPLDLHQLVAGLSDKHFSLSYEFLREGNKLRQLGQIFSKYNAIFVDLVCTLNKEIKLETMFQNYERRQKQNEKKDDVSINLVDRDLEVTRIIQEINRNVKKIKQLNISGNFVGENGIKQIIEFCGPQLLHLEILNLKNTSITSQQQLIDCLIKGNFPSLKLINLQQNFFQILSKESSDKLAIWNPDLKVTI